MGEPVQKQINKEGGVGLQGKPVYNIITTGSLPK